MASSPPGVPTAAVVIGASGHGKVVCDVLRAAGLEIVGFIDDAPTKQRTRVLGLPVLGTSAWLHGRPVRVGLGIGDNHLRAATAERLLAMGLELITCVHPHATVAPNVTLGPGTIVMAQAAINPDAVIGRGAIVNTGAIVEHDSVVGDFAHVSPRSVMGGESRVGALAQLGIGATLLPRTSVGARALIGAGAVVVRDIPDDVIATGVPARPRPRAGAPR